MCYKEGKEKHIYDKEPNKRAKEPNKRAKEPYIYASAV